MHKTLKRQLKKYLGTTEVPDKYSELFRAISRTYDGFDKDRDLIERSLDISSKELNEKNRKLKELDKQKDAFISIAAHELKTPLTSIKGFAQLMGDDRILDDKEKLRHYLDLINKNTERLHCLIMDIVDSSRIALGQVKMDIKKVDPKSILEDVKENMEMEIRGKNLKPVFRIERDVSFVQGDYERILQVIRNLVVNAIHYTQRGKISVIIKKSGENVRFIVKDTGQGIPKKNQKKLFSRFYQVDSSLTRKVGGSGLGLSVCKGLVELMDGNIGFDSKAGKGSSFYFTLPSYGEEENDRE